MTSVSRSQGEENKEERRGGGTGNCVLNLKCQSIRTSFVPEQRSPEFLGSVTAQLDPHRQPGKEKRGGKKE